MTVATTARPKKKSAPKPPKRKPPVIESRDIDPVRHYVDMVLAGKIVAGRLVKLACQRHLRDLKNPDLVWDLDAVWDAIEFFPELTHYQGDKAGQPFELEPWQEFIVGSIFGWKLKATGKRRFKRAYVEVGRKNGKSFLASGIALYMLTVDGEPGPQVYSVATKEDQAKIVWRDAKTIISYSAELKANLRCLVNRIEFEAGDGFFRPLGGDSTTLDGLNPHCAVMDELHKWRDSHLYNVIEGGMGARSQPLIFAITTAGSNMDGICRQLHDHVVGIVENNDGYTDEKTFGVIYAVDNPAKWTDEKEWVKANPNLGVSKHWHIMRDDCHKAKLIKSMEYEFKNVHLDIWTRAERKWLDTAQWSGLKAPYDLAELKGKTCVLSLDLASTQDFTAAVKVFPPDQTPDGKWAFLVRLYLPSGSLGDASKRKKYVQDIIKNWTINGHVILTPGDITDDDWIVADIEKDAKEYKVREIVIDPHQGRQMMVRLMGMGFDVFEFRPWSTNFNEPTKKLEALVASGQLSHDGNPAMAWMAGNVVIKREASGLEKPDRANSSEKIDGIVAGIMGIARWIVEPERGSKKSIYEERGMRIL